MGGGGGGVRVGGGREDEGRWGTQWRWWQAEVTEAQSFHQLVFCSETEEEKTAPPAGSEQQPQQSSLEGLAGRTALICTETQQDLNASPWLEDNNRPQKAPFYLALVEISCSPG